MSTLIEPPESAVPDASARGRRPPRWQLVVTAVLVVWLGGQFVAGWKFFHGPSYPVVGSGMFNGPPTPGGADFFMPRVFAITTSGERIELDQHTFGLEPFEWRKWVKLHLEDDTDAAAAAAAAELAAVTPGTDDRVETIEVWRVPALDDELDRGVLVRRVAL